MKWYLGRVMFVVWVALAAAGVVEALDSGPVAIRTAGSFLGETGGNQAGFSVAGAGDVNGDGYDDLLVGAPQNDDGGTNAGSAYLVLGSPDGWGLGQGLGQSQIIQYTGEAAGDQAGWSVAGAGDVNGDGYDDMLIGADSNDDGGGAAGAAYLVLGSASPASASLSTAIQYTGEAAGDMVGRNVAGAGDVNGDGFSDMLIGAPFNDDGGMSAGAAYLVLGSSSPASASLSTAIQYTGEVGGDQAGQGLAGVGDVNGDGYSDMLIGADFNDDGGTNAGAAYLVLGSASPASASLSTAIQYRGEAVGDQAGLSVAGAGDVNGDGFSDMLVGAFRNGAGGSNAGAAYLVLGSASPAGGSLSTAIKYRGEGVNDGAGVSVAGAGDVNGDGYSDILIGASANDNGSLNAGVAYLVFGSASPVGGSLSTAVQYTGKAAGDRAGISVTGAGDANGDGYSDLLVGAFQNDDAGVDAGAAYPILSDGLSSHNPAYRQQQRLGGIGDALPILFKQAGVWADFTAGALAGGDVSVTHHAFHPCSTDKRLQMPIWTVASPKMGTGATVDLRFEYTDGAIEGMMEENLAVWTRPAGRPCGDWTQVPSSIMDVDHNRITATGLTSLGQFTIADAEPSPTAVRAATMGAVLAQEPAWLVLFLAAMVVTAGMTYWLLTRRRVVDSLLDIVADKVAERLRP